MTSQNIREIISMQTKEGLKLRLIIGDVTCFSNDVIVNTVPKNLQLGGGPLSQSLLKKGGPMLQEFLNAVAEKTNEALDDMFVTNGCNLDCKAVFHVIAPYWNNGDGTSLQIMNKIIWKCLTTAEQYSYRSITFPMIGTGTLNFPKTVFAHLILSKVFEFSGNSWKKVLQEVQFVVLPDDDQGHQAFLDEFTNRSSESSNMVNIQMPEGTQGTIRIVSNPMSTIHRRKFGDITLQISTGHITKEEADNIANSLSRVFNETSDETPSGIPSYWTDMKGKNFNCVVLSPHMEKYKDIENQFIQSCPNFIIETIERIQNVDLWNSYKTKKSAMDSKNVNEVNEKWLFHGTNWNSVLNINQNGFNRSYAGKNGVSFGKGTYFAVEASYSAKSKYSTPDAQGKKYMYYARVLTGIFTVGGSSSLIEPPEKNSQNPAERYDSVTDNVQNPSLFVVFKDDQAYPEYLITYR